MWLSHKSIWMKASRGEICRLRYTHFAMLLTGLNLDWREKEEEEGGRRGVECPKM